MCLFLGARLPVRGFSHGLTVHHFVVRPTIVASEFLLGNCPIAIYFCTLVSVPSSVKFAPRHGAWVINSRYSGGDLIPQCFLQVCRIASTVLAFSSVDGSIRFPPSPSLIVGFADRVLGQPGPSVVRR